MDGLRKNGWVQRRAGSRGGMGRDGEEGGGRVGKGGVSKRGSERARVSMPSMRGRVA